MQYYNYHIGILMIFLELYLFTYNLDILFWLTISTSFSDVDTDELDADTQNVEEEVVEFFIKEEITVMD